mmetsp:Transcript_58140/g.185008  ORF Transcript_58140/g.185008 Transcript_58140/m.185008 type:complete len:230 (+) Transcript_58140:2362-3051(+)
MESQVEERRPDCRDCDGAHDWKHGEDRLQLDTQRGHGIHLRHPHTRAPEGEGADIHLRGNLHVPRHLEVYVQDHAGGVALMHLDTVHHHEGQQAGLSPNNDIDPVPQLSLELLSDDLVGIVDFPADDFSDNPPQLGQQHIQPQRPLHAWRHDPGGEPSLGIVCGSRRDHFLQPAAWDARRRCRLETNVQKGADPRWGAPTVACPSWHAFVVDLRGLLLAHSPNLVQNIR